MNLFFVLIFCVFSAFHRRWFGGGFFREGFLSKRGVQCAVYLIATTALAYYLFKLPLWWLNLIASIVFSVWTYCQFWARGHGMSMDQGRDVSPLESTIERYNERWYHYICDFIFPNHLYGFFYDSLYHLLRYTCPLVALFAFGLIPVYFGLSPLFDWKIILIGLSVFPIYAFSWTCFEREEWFFKKYSFLNRAIHLAEFLAGFVWGFWVLCLN